MVKVFYSKPAIENYAFFYITQKGLPMKSSSVNVFFRFTHLFIFSILFLSYQTQAYQPCPGNQRTMTVANSSSEDIWLGVAAGTISCLSDSDCPTGATGSCQGASPPAAGTCSCAENTNACGSVSQCNTNNNYCYWNLPTNAGVKIDANGGLQTLCFQEPDGSKPFQWSGNMFARTGCDANGQNCETGECGNAANKPCPTGTGGNPPVSLVEFTLSNQTPAASSPGPDFYDVSIINGVNLAVQMGPASETYASAKNDPYSCETAGAAAGTKGGLSGCNWKINPTIAGKDYSSTLQNVHPSTFSGKTCPSGKAPNSLGYCECSTATDCNGISGSVCGLAQNAVKGKILGNVCGEAIGWWSADQICGMDGSFGAPIHCGKTTKGGQSYTALLGCTGVASCYNSAAKSDCCGCGTSKHADGKWPTVIGPGFGGSDNGCYSNNTDWVSDIQPWLSYLKTACPTAYVYPYDDATSTFTCAGSRINDPKGKKVGPPDYNVIFSDLN